MGVQLFTNNATSTLAGNISDVATSLSVAAGHGARFPAITGTDYFYVTLVDGASNKEIVKVTARSTDTFTVTRAQEGTVAQAFTAGDVVELRPTAAGLTNMVQKTGSSLTIDDANLTIQDNSDQTKQAQFQLSSITTGTTRIYTLPDENVEFAGRGSNTFTGAQNEAHGADVASASTINLTTTTGNLVDVTGTTSITTITLVEGAERTVRFTGALTLTHGASLVLPGGANITTAAGDFAIFRGYAAGVVRCVAYTKASGVPVVSSSNGLQLLSTVVASSASSVVVDTTFSSTYDMYIIEASGITFSSNGADVYMQFKLGGAYDTGANYQVAAMYLDSNSAVSIAINSRSGVSDTDILRVGTGNTSGYSMSFTMNIPVPASTSLRKAVYWNAVGVRSTGYTVTERGSAMNSSSTSAFTGIKFIPTAGTINGTFRLYGISNT